MSDRAYIARRPCGCVGGVCDAHGLPDCVASFVEDGMTLELVDWDTARASLKGAKWGKCEHERRASTAPNPNLDR